MDESDSGSITDRAFITGKASNTDTDSISGDADKE